MALAMPAIYRVDGNSVVTSPDAAGPWDRRMQHGSAPAALVTWAAERIPTPVPMNIARVTIDLMRPVPVAPLTIETEVLREGRKIQLCEVKLLADGVQVVGATVLKIKQQSLTLPDDVKELPVTLPSPEDSLVEDGHGATSPFAGMVSMRAARGRFGQAGAGAIWFRARPSAGRGRGGLAGDARRGRRRFLQRHRLDARLPHLDLHQRRPHVSFARQPVGEWILLDGESWIGPDGAGLAMSRLADRQGYFGRAVQSLVIEKR